MLKRSKIPLQKAIFSSQLDIKARENKVASFFKFIVGIGIHPLTSQRT